MKAQQNYETLKNEIQQLKVEIEQKNIENEQLFNEMNSGFAIHKMIFDPNQKPTDYIFLKVNKAFEKLTGLKAENIIGKRIKEIIPDLEELFIERYGRVAVSQVPEKFESFAKALNRYYEISAYSPKKEYFATIFSDITARKLAEAKMHESEKKYRTIFNNAPLGIFRSTPNGKFIEVNNALVQMLGYDTADELIGSIKNIAADIYVNPEKRATIVEHSLGSEQICKYENLYKRRDGSIFTGHLILNTIKDENNNILYLEGIVEDITKRKLAERSLKESEQKLRQQNEEFLSLNEELSESYERIKEINKILLIAKQKAEENDHLKTAFLQNMSHEIRTPMNGIIGFAEMLKDPEIGEEKRKYYIEIINNSCQQLLNIVNDILDISKIETSQTELHITEFNLNELLYELYSFFSNAAFEKKISLNYYKMLDDDKSMVITDKEKLRKILNNLISNAIKFTHSGNVKFGYQIEDSNVVFLVEDTGIGISPDSYDKIFERFSQADTSISSYYGGTGLGLAISKAYVEMLGGKIWLNSQIHKGSQFYFTIPFANSINQKTENSFNQHDMRKVILIVEDENINYLFTKEAIKSLDFKIIRALNGKEAVEICQVRNDIVIVLMDIKMPIMNGYDATKEIKHIKPNLPIIAMTAYAFSDDKMKALQAGCDDYISKPVKKQELITVIKQFINE